MLFDKPVYILFLALVVALYWRLPWRAQNAFLLAASYFFYGWWDWRFCSSRISAPIMAAEKSSTSACSAGSCPASPPSPGKLAGGPAVALPPDLVEQSAQRLDELNTLCRTYGARLVVWVPPSRQWLDRSDLVRAGNLADVPVLVSGEGDRIEAERFADGYHLDALGAQQWTGVLMPRLRPLLGSERNGRAPR
jgi:hypothetical protein